MAACGLLPGAAFHMTTVPLPPGRKPLLVRLHLATWRVRVAWLCSLILATVVVIWVMIRATPSSYRPLDPSQQVVSDLSLRAQGLIQFELRNAAQKVPLGEQRWTITQDEVNSLLATLTAGPLNADGTRQRTDERISDPFISFGPGTVSVSARIRDIPSGYAQGGVGTLTFAVGIADVNGRPMGFVKLLGAKVGMLP